MRHKFFIPILLVLLLAGTTWANPATQVESTVKANLTQAVMNWSLGKAEQDKMVLRDVLGKHSFIVPILRAELAKGGSMERAVTQMLQVHDWITILAEQLDHPALGVQWRINLWSDVAVWARTNADRAMNGGSRAAQTGWLAMEYLAKMQRAAAQVQGKIKSASISTMKDTYEVMKLALELGLI